LKFGGTATKAYPHHTPAGKAMYQILGVFAEFERAIIIERVKSGLARARSQGKRLGRRPVCAEVIDRIRAVGDRGRNPQNG
jgi:DNA invertase Pin-like site-specific DNA recombinase